MNEENIRCRREYINRVRESFPAAETGTRTNAYGQEKEDMAGGAAIMKVKWLLAFFLFLCFILCDKMEYPFFAMQPDEIYQKIEKNYDYTNLQEYVMMISDF